MLWWSWIWWNFRNIHLHIFMYLPFLSDIRDCMVSIYLIHLPSAYGKSPLSSFEESSHLPWQAYLLIKKIIHPFAQKKQNWFRKMYWQSIRIYISAVTKSVTKFWQCHKVMTCQNGVDFVTVSKRLYDIVKKSFVTVSQTTGLSALWHNSLEALKNDLGRYPALLTLGQLKLAILE